VDAVRAPGVAAPSRSELEPAFARALHFLRDAGDASALRHAEASLGLRPVREVEEALEAEVPEAAGDARCAAALFQRLASLRALRGRTAARLAHAVEALQRPDGAFRAPGDADDAPEDPALPPFLRAGSDPVFLTAMLGGCLALSGAASPASVKAAGAWLGERWSPDRVQGGSWHGIASLFHFFASGDHELSDEAMQWCGRELERGFRTRAFGGVETGEVFVLCAATALPGARLAAGEVARAVVEEQGADGGWRPHGARAPGAGDPAETARAIAVLLHLAGVRPGSLAPALAAALASG